MLASLGRWGAVTGRYDGVWTELDGEGIDEESLHLFSITGGEEEVVAVGDGSHLARFDGTSWRALIEGSFTEPNLLAVAIVDGVVWAAGARGAIVRGE